MGNSVSNEKRSGAIHGLDSCVGPEWRVSDAATCSVCLDMISDPALCSSGHAFCHPVSAACEITIFASYFTPLTHPSLFIKCLSAALRTRVAARATCCPMCNVPQNLSRGILRDATLDALLKDVSATRRVGENRVLTRPTLQGEF